MSRACVGFVGCALGLTLAIAGTAHAGPIELFNETVLQPGAPSQMLVPYMYGGAGMFVSSDGGKDFGLLCTAAIDPKVVDSRLDLHLNAAGEIYIGNFDGLWRGDKNGCNFAVVPEMLDHYVGDITSDPLDEKRTYVVTTDASPAENGLFMNDGSGTFTKYGNHHQLFINTVHVVKNGEGRRFYETGVQTNLETNEVKYFVRYSDDEAMTWTDNEYPLMQFGPMDMYAEFAIVGIDPANPDHVLARVRRTNLVDSFVFSTSKGEAGSWMQIAEPNDLAALAFTPDGKLYFGDNSQMSPSLYVVDKLGDAPRELAKGWKVGCLKWDESTKTMFACNDFKFGNVNLETGELTITLDMRCGARFAECPNSPMPMRDMCSAQMMADYCHVSHYPAAPLCAGYEQPGGDAFINALDYMCEDGKPAKKPGTGGAGGDFATPAGMGGPGVPPVGAGGSVAAGGTGATAGAGGAAVSPAEAGAGGSGGSSAPAEPASVKSSGGCSVAASDSAEGAFSALFSLAAVGLGLAVSRKRRR
ncbi:MAG: hypothetical protein ABW321_02095 [Polyangiales bacterium]